MMNTNNLQVFKDTLRMCQNEYREETEDVKKMTEVLIAPISDFLFMPHPKMPNKNMQISIENNGTVAEGRRHIGEGRVAILNFADGCTPGGLVWSGESTQEENICRCSNLYPTLTQDICRQKYYLPNAKTHGEYTDALIYSRDVLFFRNDTDYSLVEPYKMDVITCPAPSTNLKERTYEVIKNRALHIVKSAIYNKVDVLILGAWGCGAFGQSPEFVSRAFVDAVTTYNAFDKVIFAIRGCDCDSNERVRYIWNVFKKNIEVHH